ncbi:hypothetical protein D3C77_495270 [compost metagenome]
MQALHEVPGGQAVAQQDHQQQEQQRHHDTQALLKPRHHATGNHQCRQQHEQAVPQHQAPGVTDHAIEVAADLIGRHALEVTPAHVDDVVERPAPDHTVERQDQQRRDHPGEGPPRPARRMPRLQGEVAQGIGRTLPGAAADQRLGKHHRDTDQGNAGQEHQNKGTAAVDADHVGEFPDTSQPHRSTGGRQYEYPATGPATMDRNLVRRHQHAQLWKKRARIVRDSLQGLKLTATP